MKKDAVKFNNMNDTAKEENIMNSRLLNKFLENFVKEVYTTGQEIVDGKKAIDTRVEAELEIELSDDQLDEIYDFLYDTEESSDVDWTSDQKYGKYLSDCWPIGEHEEYAYIWTELNFANYLCDSFEYADGKLKISVEYAFIYWLLNDEFFGPNDISKDSYEEIMETFEELQDPYGEDCEEEDEEYEEYEEYEDDDSGYPDTMLLEGGIKMYHVGDGVYSDSDGDNWEFM